ncbi:MAG: penicillin-binding protein 2 [Spirobacillus cienkowskii]|uniref:Penicillin-binding protein 2 n=1 Tax=Spirobacillus cienkowskii TaxID=495820 RepID=A0A369KWW1_9BACT|nr:MAG: penicillin-binding protein 2 [Spirobacillus cienkowskii]
MGKVLILLNNIKNYFNYKNLRKIPNFSLRAHLLGWLYYLCLILILIRYAWITFFPTPLRSKLIEKGNKQFETNLTMSLPRATITDRNGRVLAVSITKPSIYLLNKKMPNDNNLIKSLADQLQIPFNTLKAYKNDKRNFIWLKRQINYDEAARIGSLKKWQDFVGVVDEHKRVYPEKELAAQLIGFVGAEGHGLEGIEKIYDSRLNMKPIKLDVMKDARGRLVMVTPNHASKPDQKVPNLKLSIDLSIQEITQNALKNGVIKADAKGGSAIVMDVKTGEILAIASWPYYDLNNPPENNPDARRFRPVMDAIELGSVVKPMWIAKALDLGIIKPDSKIFVEKGKMNLPGGAIHDTHPYDWLTPEEILKYSSNIGVYKVVQKMGKEIFYDSLMKIGFGRSPGTGLPGEWAGRIKKTNTWKELNFANMSFGQGFAISPLQLAHALSIIVGGGKDRGVNLIAVDPLGQTEPIGPPLQIINPKTCKLISQMLKSVVEEEGGTGAQARIPGILVAGKTGTAQIWSTKDRAYSGRTAVFEGIIPSNDPKLVIVVVIDEAGIRPAYGGLLAGPVFSEIGKKTVHYLNSRGIYKMTEYKNSYLKNQNSQKIIKTAIDKNDLILR